MNKNGLSLRRLATILGVSQPFLFQIRAGKRPLTKALKKKVTALGAYNLFITPTSVSAYLDTNDDFLPGLGPGGGSSNLATPTRYLSPFHFIYCSVHHSSAHLHGPPYPTHHLVGVGL